MDFYEYLHVLARRWWIIAVAVLGIAGGLYWYGVSRPTTYDAVNAIHFVKNSEPQATQGSTYQYDDYYALESSRLFSQLVVGWLADPANVAEIYRTAGVEIPNKSLFQYDRLIRVDSLTGSSLQIVTNAQTQQEAARLNEATKTLITNRVSELNESQVLGPIHLMTSGALTQANTPSTLLFLVVGAFVGVILGLIIAFSVEYLSATRSRK